MTFQNVRFFYCPNDVEGRHLFLVLDLHTVRSKAAGDAALGLNRKQLLLGAEVVQELRQVL